MYALLFCLPLPTTCVFIWTFFSSVSTLFAFSYCTAYSVRRGHKADILLFSFLATEKGEKKNATTWQVTAQQNPNHKLRPSCATAIYRYIIAKQEFTVVVHSASPASASCKHQEQNNETFVPSSHSKAKTTAQQPLFFWMEANKMILFLHFPQWVQKMFVRIILLF